MTQPTPDPDACSTRRVTDKLRHMPRPCDPSATSGACPFRRDADPAEFPAQRFELLANTAGGPGREAPIGAPMFACHHTADGREVACAGWLAVCGTSHLGVRFAAAMGALDPAALNPQPGWPELFDDYEQMAAAQADGPYDPRTAREHRREAGHYGPLISKVRR